MNTTKIKQYIKKNILSIINLVFFISLTVISIICNSNYNENFRKIEMENRAYKYRPKIELKHSDISKIVLIRDTSWIQPKVDIAKGGNKDFIKEVPLLTEAKFSFTIINNNDNIADILEIIFIDTAASIPRSTANIFSGSGSDTLYDGYIQLDCLDTTTFSFTHKISSLDENGNFYLHFIVYYQNQFEDMYETYFVIKGKVGNPGFILVKPSNKYSVRVNKLYMKNNFIKLDYVKKYVSYMSEPGKENVKNNSNRIIKKYDLIRQLQNKILK